MKFFLFFISLLFLNSCGNKLDPDHIFPTYGTPVDEEVINRNPLPPKQKGL